MFKGILPSSRRTASQDAPSRQQVDNGKENRPELPQDIPKPWVNPPVRVGDGPMLKPKEKEGRLVEAGATNRAFEKMLDDMQIPSTLRPKLITLDSPVKAAMLKSSHSLGLAAPLGEPSLLPHSNTSPSLRRAKSSETLSNSPGRPGHGHTASVDGLPSIPRPNFGSRPTSGSFRNEDLFKHPDDVSKDLFARMDSLDLSGADSAAQDAAKWKNTKGRNAKEKERKDKEQSAEAMCSWLSSTKSSVMEIEKVKKLRLLLRNESASWSETFLRNGGYAALMARLIEILDMEWREEQHDDQALHEILRCFKALSTSSIGCFALRSSCPTPFAQLVALLYSDKKPGDIATRQLMVDLLLILFELYPSAGTRNVSRSAWENKGSGHVIPPARPTVFTRPPSSAAPDLPAPHESIFSLIRGLLLTPRPAPSESPSIPISPHAFIAQLHLPRIYKVYLKELSDVCRDYFWAFCHPNNTIWDMDKTDEEKVEKPRAPNAITGGVEFEAMSYLTTHFRLVNTLCRAAADLDLPATDEKSAHKLHADLFASGFEPIILTARKSSTAYYPNLHLEIARYVLLAHQARFELPYTIERMIGPPPSAVYRVYVRPQATPTSTLGASGSIPAGYFSGASRPGSPLHPPTSPSKRNANGAPLLPPQRRMEEIIF